MLAIAEPSSVMVWADRVRAEYEDLPGLSLTRDQMVRLFSVDARTCDELLEMLTVACILRKTPQGTYVGWHSAY